MALSVAEQHRRIRKDYPDFKLVCDLGFMGVWEGHLTPIFQKYKIRITYVQRQPPCPVPTTTMAGEV
ncbi:MAG: hypothetical protein ACOH2L_17265, partial [Devosia sp.]